MPYPIYYVTTYSQAFYYSCPPSCRRQASKCWWLPNYRYSFRQKYQSASLYICGDSVDPFYAASLLSSPASSSPSSLPLSSSPYTLLLSNVTCGDDIEGLPYHNKWKRWADPLSGWVGVFHFPHPFMYSSPFASLLLMVVLGWVPAHSCLSFMVPLCERTSKVNLGHMPLWVVPSLGANVKVWRSVSRLTYLSATVYTYSSFRTSKCSKILCWDF